MSDIPDICHAVVIGGGVVGSSVAFHLAQFGVGPVVLLERNALAAQASSRAAGLLTKARPKAAQIPLVQRTHDAIRELEQELGDAVGFRMTGSLHVATSARTAAALDELIGTADQFGIPVKLLDGFEARRLAPWLDAQEALRLAFMPEDGFIDPYLLATAYARAARRRGVHIACGVAAQQILVERGVATGVLTASGPVRARYVIDACGAWAGLLALPLDIRLPFAPVRSHYWITSPAADYPRDMPCAILPDARAYIRPEQGGVVIGVREAHSLTLDARTLPPDLTGMSFGDVTEGWQLLLEEYGALHRLYPQIAEAHLTQFITGLSTYTPDGQFVVGPVSDLPRYVVVSGCCGAGVAASGGLGRAVAELVAERPTSFDLTPFSPDRFGEVDPFSPEFRKRCSDARSQKASG